MAFPDDLVSTLVDVFLGGPDDWKARLGTSIQFISPEGNEFEAKWLGDSRTMEKKLGIFVFPRVAGNVVQDLDVNSTQYSTTFYFDGKDCDLNSKAFFQSAAERGRWTITHPVHGFLELQLITIKENDNLVVEGGYVAIETEWIEPIDEDTLLTAAEAAGIVDSGIDDLNTSAFEQFTEALDTATEALSNGINTVVNGVANVTDFVLSPLTSTVDALDNTTNLVQNGINDTLNATVLDVQSLAGQIQQLVTLPALATTNIESSQSLYDDAIDAWIALLPDTRGALAEEEANQALVVELALSAALSAYARIAVNGIRAAQAAGVQIPTTDIVLEGEPIQTRAQAVAAAVKTAETFTKITNALDLVQEAFETKDIDKQFFAQAFSFNDAAQLMGQTIKFLLISSFDLKIERRIVLDQPRCPVEIVVSEYGTLGDNDSNLDLFIKSNSLSGDDIYMLPPGREVVIYA
jgi:prophage DNA circulation protein